MYVCFLKKKNFFFFYNYFVYKKWKKNDNLSHKSQKI